MVTTAKTKLIELGFSGYWRVPNLNGVPDTSGIYTVYACTNTSKSMVSIRKLLYIGESAGARTRIRQHLAGQTGKAWKRLLRPSEELCFGHAPALQADRERGEAALIFKHKPPANTQCVDDFPYERTRVVSRGRAALLAPDFIVG